MSPPQPRLWLGECMKIYNIVVEQSIKINCWLFLKEVVRFRNRSRTLNGMKCIFDKQNTQSKDRISIQSSISSLIHFQSVPVVRVPRNLFIFHNFTLCPQVISQRLQNAHILSDPGAGGLGIPDLILLICPCKSPTYTSLSLVQVV